MIGAQGRLRIASVSKPIMAATVLRLVDQKKVDLDAGVDELPARGAARHR